MSDVKLDFQPSKPYSTKGTLIVYAENGAIPLHSDTFDLASDSRRTAFVKKVAQEHKGIPAEKITSAILAEVSKIMAEKRKATEKMELEIKALREQSPKESKIITP